MRRKLKLAALMLLVAMLMTGCMADFSAMNAQTETDPNATAEPTVAPLTAPVFTDREALYQWYNEVQVGDTLEELKARYGEPIVTTDRNGDTYCWMNEEGYGFTAIFFENGVLRAKVVQYEDLRQMKDLSLATDITNFSVLDTQDDFTMACMALGGKPCELATVILDSSANPDTQRVFVWLDEYGSNVQILFDKNEKIIQISYARADRTE